VCFDIVMSSEGMPEKGSQMEVSKDLVDKVRATLIKELREFSEGDVAPEVKQNTLELVADLEAGRPAAFGGRIFPEYLDGAIEKSGVKLYSPEYQSIRKQLESPEKSG
jgi:hypothetical protein